MPLDASRTKYPFPEPDAAGIAAQFEHLADAIPQHIWGASPLGELDYKNLRGRAFFGIEDDADPLRGKWIRLVHPDDRAYASERWRRSLETETPYECEFRLRRHDGVYVWHLAQALPYRDDQGKLVRWFGTNTDISRQKTAEESLRRALEDLERTRAALTASNAELDAFATLVAHDLRGPLRSVRASLDELRDDPQRTESLERAARGVEMTGALITKLLESSRAFSEALERQWVDLGRCIDDVAELLAADIARTRATITKDALLPKVWADPVQLREVFQNIIANALLYAGDAPPRITVRAAQGERAIRIDIRDEGVGFPQEEAARAFNANVRLPSSEGTSGLGLGLSICKRIVERHGGTIRAQSVVGRGTTIMVTLPMPEKTSLTT